MGFKEVLGKIFNKEKTVSLDSLEKKRMMPEEVELMGYAEEDRRDWIRQEVMRQRQKRLSHVLGTANYGASQQIKLPTPKKKIPKPNYLKPYSFNCK